MAFVHGKDSYFMLNAVELTTFITDVSFNQSVDVAETSTMGGEAKSYLAGMSDSTISISGRYDSTVTTGPDAVLSVQVGADAVVAWIFGPEGGTTGKEKYNGNCILTSYNMTAPVADIVAFTAEFQVSGAITKGTFA